MPETLLALTYVGILIYNTNQIIEYREDIIDLTWQLARHLALIIVILTLIIFDMALRVSKLNS